MLYLWHQRARRQTASIKQIRGTSWRTSGLLLLSKQVVDIDPHTSPPPQNAAEDPLTPHGLRILRPQQPFGATSKLEDEKALKRALADKTILKGKFKASEY
ncbi:hypothetical protein D1P53_002033 [Cryptococcus gattii VGV]|nr:hypothetical protein D1P53_002033 [Cryptococcus gattii VGV]